jgi:NAD(P)-dependent dehydrogenase (short-subunit alcohol dehydrogenase family)
MSEPRGPAGKNVVVTGGAKGQGDSHVLAFAEAGCDIAVLDVTSPVEGVHALATAEMTDATVKAVEERGVRCHHAPRIAA